MATGLTQNSNEGPGDLTTILGVGEVTPPGLIGLGTEDNDLYASRDSFARRDDGSYSCFGGEESRLVTSLDDSQYAFQVEPYGTGDAYRTVLDKPTNEDAYRLPVQAPYRLPVQDAYRPPVVDAYRPPLQDAYRPPVQDAYLPPVQDAYQHAYQPPVRTLDELLPHGDRLCSFSTPALVTSGPMHHQFQSSRHSNANLEGPVPDYQTSTSTEFAAFASSFPGPLGHPTSSMSQQLISFIKSQGYQDRPSPYFIFWRFVLSLLNSTLSRGDNQISFRSSAINNIFYFLENYLPPPPHDDHPLVHFANLVIFDRLDEAFSLATATGGNLWAPALALGSVVGGMRSANINVAFARTFGIIDHPTPLMTTTAPSVLAVRGLSLAVHGASKGELMAAFEETQPDVGKLMLVTTMVKNLGPSHPATELILSIAVNYFGTSDVALSHFLKIVLGDSLSNLGTSEFPLIGTLDVLNSSRCVTDDLSICGFMISEILEYLGRYNHPQFCFPHFQRAKFDVARALKSQNDNRKSHLYADYCQRFVLSQPGHLHSAELRQSLRDFLGPVDDPPPPVPTAGISSVLLRGLHAVARAAKIVDDDVPDVPKSNFDVPKSNFDVPKSNFDVPKSNFDVPKSNFDVPKSNFDVPTPAVGGPPVFVPAELPPPPPTSTQRKPNYHHLSSRYVTGPAKFNVPK